MAEVARVKVARWATVQRFAVTAYLNAAAWVLPLFDASPLVASDLSTSLTLRWDAFYFASIVHRKYVYEQHWAFFQGVPFIARLLARLFRRDVLFVASAVSFLCNPILHLYDLTFEITGSVSVSKLVGALSLLPSSPATFIYAPYSEPFFTMLSYTGMLACAQGRYQAASLAFTLTTVFRSNGVVLGGFILWDLVVEPVIVTRTFSALKPRRTLLAILLSLAPVAPLLLHERNAYLRFCGRADSPVWCSAAIPSIYLHIQGKYWDNGFLRYWTPSQLPNFLIAAPVYTLLLSGCYVHLRDRLRGATKDNFFRSRRLTPHALHAAFLSLSLLFAGNVQIMLRLAASMPFVYWSAAWLWLEHPKWAKLWVAWSACWGALSVLLWAAFLPPA